jgi:hypothetical protein
VLEEEGLLEDRGIDAVDAEVCRQIAQNQKKKKLVSNVKTHV